MDSYKKIIRIMPNTPCTVGEGMILLCRSVCFDAVEAAYQKADAWKPTMCLPFLCTKK